MKYFLYAAVIGCFTVLSPTAVQAQWWGTPGYATSIYPPPGSSWYLVPRAPSFAPPLSVLPVPTYVVPPVVYVQPSPPDTADLGSVYNAPPGYRWKNVWDNACQCNRAVLVSNQGK